MSERGPRRQRPPGGWSAAESFARLAGHVRRGEWTTYGDISIAVTGTTQAARAVGRAAATDPDFPAPHRVLLASGAISPHWVTDEGLGPEECRRRLEQEGVRFTAAGTAGGSHHVGWPELVARDDDPETH